MLKTESAEMFEHRLAEWNKQKRLLEATRPQSPRMRLSPDVSVCLEGDLAIYGRVHGGQDNDVRILLDKREAIDLAHFIIELFGDKYSPD
jgi:hypothetical protein